MFNIESEYDKYRREAEFVEIEGYNNSGEKIEDKKNEKEEQDEKRNKKGLKKTILSLFLFGTIGTIGYFGYNNMQNQENFQKKAVMGVFTQKSQKENHLNREEIEKGLDNLNQEEEKQQKLDETITNLVDDFVASKKPSYAPKKDISNELNGMVDSFYNQEAIPNKLNSMVDDFYSEQSPAKNSRFVTIKDGDTLAKIAKKFYGSHLEYQKIIDANHKLKKSAILYIGQKINVPY